MDARKQRIITAFKDKVRRDFSRSLGIQIGMIEVEIRAGSVIIVGKIDPANMPAEFDLGDGSNLLQGLKEMDGAADLVEEGMSLDRCFVDPEPDFPVDDEAAAVGDPHLQFASGGTADLCCDGGHCVPCSGL